MKNKNEFPIDIIIPWVNGNDPEWLQVRNHYASVEDLSKRSVAANERYVDDGLLHYLFRGIEKYAPWVNKIFFVTFGHLPDWLNTKHPKLVVVKHEDFIPKHYLPTFNSSTIMLNIHRIKGLSEHFILFNDDIYILKSLKKKDFFVNGLPCDMASQECIETFYFQDTFNSILINDLCLLNKISNKKKSQKTHLTKWINIRYGLKRNIKTLLLFPYNLYTGIYDPHIATSYKKETYQLIWEIFNQELDNVCQNKFRSHNDCNEYLMRYYNLTVGLFKPSNRSKIGTYRVMSSKDLPTVINKRKFKLLCINYSDKNRQKEIADCFNKLFPSKSNFEK